MPGALGGQVVLLQAIPQGAVLLDGHEQLGGHHQLGLLPPRAVPSIPAPPLRRLSPTLVQTSARQLQFLCLGREWPVMEITILDSTWG